MRFNRCFLSRAQLQTRDGGRRPRAPEALCGMGPALGRNRCRPSGQRAPAWQHPGGSPQALDPRSIALPQWMSNHPAADVATYRQVDGLACCQALTPPVTAAYPLRMPKASLNVSLTPELMSYVADRVAVGQYRSASEVLRAGLRLLQREDGISAAAQATHASAKEPSRSNQRFREGS